MASRLTGVKELDDLLQALPDKLVRKVLIEAIAVGGTELKRAIKNQIPGRHKGARQAIGSKFVRAQRLKKNQVRGKVGGGVGINKARRAALDEQHKKRRGTRPGVGISVSNVHWWILGTDKRKQKTTGRETGSMPPTTPSPVKAGLAASGQRVLAKVTEQIRKGVQREVAKLKAKHKA